MPCTFDQYDHCSYNCLYCFSFFQKSLKAFNPLYPNEDRNYQAMPVRAVRPEYIRRLIAGEVETQFKEYFRQGLTMQWGGLSDPFDEFESRYGVGLEILGHLRAAQYPVCFSTKGTWWTEDPRYVAMFEGAKHFNTKVTIINTDAGRAAAIERGVPTPQARIQAIGRIAGWGAGGVTLRLRPFLIGLSDVNDEYLDLIGMAHRAGATAVSTEFFCLEGRAPESLRKRYDAMSEVVGYDVLDFYKHNSPNRGVGYMRLNHKIKAPYIAKMESLCARLGMRFYVSDAHHKDRCAGGSCCGLESTGWKYCKGQYTQVLHTARQRYERALHSGSSTSAAQAASRVYWGDEMEPYLGQFKSFLWRYAEGFNTKGTRDRMKRFKQTMYDYIHEMWNNPNHPKAPYKYFHGLLHPVLVDQNGDVVYEYHSYDSSHRVAKRQRH
jgi:DNA repair photolyase